MTVVVYDGSYEGWLTAVFDCYTHRLKDVSFSRTEGVTGSLSGDLLQTIPDEAKTERVLAGLRKRLSAEGMKRLHKTFLSEIEGRESVM